MYIEDRLLCVYCEVIQKIQNASNHLRVYKEGPGRVWEIGAG
jgi:hypothetical protein